MGKKKMKSELKRNGNVHHAQTQRKMQTLTLNLNIHLRVQNPLMERGNIRSIGTRSERKKRRKRRIKNGTLRGAKVMTNSNRSRETETRRRNGVITIIIERKKRNNLRLNLILNSVLK